MAYQAEWFSALVERSQQRVLERPRTFKMASFLAGSKAT